jgi:iron complex transport system ATP-binding protein
MNLLQMEHISVQLDKKVIVDDVSMTLDPGEMIGLIGPNGAGKTTLLRTLAGLQSQSSGSFCLNENLENQGRDRVMAYLAQSPEVHWPLTVERVVALGRIPHLSPWSRGRDEDRLAVQEALQQTDMTAYADRAITTLSGGERVRALIARALAVEPKIILADEPVAALDPLHRLQVMELLRDHCRNGGGAIVVLHDLTLAARYCSRLVLMDSGRIVLDDIPANVIAGDKLEQVYGVRTRVIKDGDDLIVVPWGALRGERR